MLFLEVQQRIQTSLRVVTGNSEVRSSCCHGIRPNVELRGNTMSFQLTVGNTGFFLSFNR